MKMKEADVQRAIINYLERRGWYVMVTDAGEAARSSRTHGRRGKLRAGTPDLVAQKKRVSFMIEVKGPKGKLSERQKLEHAYISSHGVLVVVAKSHEDLAPALEEMDRLIEAIESLNQ